MRIRTARFVKYTRWLYRQDYERIGCRVVVAHRVLGVWLWTEEVTEMRKMWIGAVQRYVMPDGEPCDWYSSSYEVDLETALDPVKSAMHVARFNKRDCEQRGYLRIDVQSISFKNAHIVNDRRD